MVELHAHEIDWNGRLRSIAADAVRRLSAIDGVAAIALIGSVARGDATQWSDIDLLVIVDDHGPGRETLLDALPPFSRRRSSLVLMTLVSLRRQVAQGAHFIDHIREEGHIAYDPSGTLASCLRQAYRVNIRRDVDRLRRVLDVYADPYRFGQQNLFVLSHLYSLGKAMVMLALAVADVKQFNRDRAFETLAQVVPALTDDVGRIALLRPFYAVTMRRKPEAIPFSHTQTSAQLHVRDAHDSIRRVSEWILRSAERFETGDARAVRHLDGVRDDSGTRVV
jgi:predicted nucleotidyltransferase